MSSRRESATFYRNGDQADEGFPVRLDRRKYKTLEQCLDYINGELELGLRPHGYRYIFSTNGRRVKDLERLHNGREYVLSVEKDFIKAIYGKGVGREISENDYEYVELQSSADGGRKRERRARSAPSSGRDRRAGRRENRSAGRHSSRPSRSGDETDSKAKRSRAGSTGDKSRSPEKRKRSPKRRSSSSAAQRGRNRSSESRKKKRSRDIKGKRSSSSGDYPKKDDHESHKNLGKTERSLRKEIAKLPDQKSPLTVTLFQNGLVNDPGMVTTIPEESLDSQESLMKFLNQNQKDTGFPRIRKIFKTDGHEIISPKQLEDAGSYVLAASRFIHVQYGEKGKEFREIRDSINRHKTLLKESRKHAAENSYCSLCDMDSGSGSD